MRFVFNRESISQAGKRGLQPAKIDESRPALGTIGAGPERVAGEFVVTPQ
jgi:hypothetical protein